MSRRAIAVVGAGWAVATLALLAVTLGVELEPSGAFLCKLGLAVLVVGGIFLSLSLWILGPQSTRRLCINLSVSGLVLGLCLLLAEAATRSVYGDVTTTNLHCGYFDSRWRRENPPRLNSWGFRERDFSEVPASGTYRIAVIGDSITYGQGLPEQERMTNRLEARLAESNSAYEVLNFGRRGAETVDHVGFLRDAVLGVSPDFVLLQWYVNDFEGRDKSGRPRLLKLAPSDTLHSLLLAKSALYCLAQKAWNQVTAGLGLTGSHHAYMKARFGDPQSPDSKVWLEAVSSFIELTRERGVPLGLVLYPDPSFFRQGAKSYGFGFLHDRVLGICADYAVPCLDLRNTFSDVEDWRPLELNVFDAHPSALANDLMTEAILGAFADQWHAAAKRGGSG